MKYYKVNGQSYVNKVEALMAAGTTNSKIQFMFHHETFSKVDNSNLGKINLDILYRQRAQQIRDSYDYLILYYSGGADSHNILKTFFSNGIPLDEIVVRWPKKLIGSGIYIPNSVDQTARNFVSEWDLVIENDLKFISKHYPKIKITILDYTEGVTAEYYNEDRFKLQNHMHSAVNLLRMQKFTDIELNPKGKKVCAIAGLDKPQLVERKGTVYMFFMDDIVSLQTSAEESTREDFYWTPDMPNLAYEMAYTVFQYFKANPMLRNMLPKYHWTELEETIKFDGMQMYYRLIKPVIYSSWNNNRFQADKPFQGFKADKDFWFYESGEFDSLVQSWRHHYDSQLSLIKEELCIVDTTGAKTGYKPVFSPLYRIGSF